MRAAEESSPPVVDLDPADRAARAGKPMLPPDEIDSLVRAALAEDLGTAGDVTSQAVIPASRRARGRLLAKEAGVVAGLAVFGRVFQQLDEEAVLTARRADGDAMAPGDVLLEVVGSARALLAGERTALNFVQRLCGIASLTRRFVERAGPAVRVVDTRKTTPLLRTLEKYAVTCGGGANHRFGLFDQAMLKNNHVDVGGRDLAELVRELRTRHGDGMIVHVEARDAAEARAAVAGGADVVLLDNMSVDAMRAVCAELRALPADRPFEIEASGGIDLDTIADVAASGVDRVSVGALTHSAPAADLAFRLERLP